MAFVQQRLMRELKMFASGKLMSDEGIALACDPTWSNGSDLTRLVALVCGPADTPYDGGFFLLSIHVPSDYPNQPPRVTNLTTDSGRRYFHPNFYSNGKVCVSTLNTAQGTAENEGWTAALNLLAVLRSIQSLLAENPFSRRNPSAAAGGGVDADKLLYDAKIYHEVLRVTVCDQIEQNKIPEMWMGAVRQRLARDFGRHCLRCDELGQQYDGRPFDKAFFEEKEHPETARFAFKELKQRLVALNAGASPRVESKVIAGFRGPPSAIFDECIFAALQEAEKSRTSLTMLLDAIRRCLQNPSEGEASSLGPEVTGGARTLAQALGYDSADVGSGRLVLDWSKANRENFETAQVLLSDALESC